MTAELLSQSLRLALPEVILAVGALALLMIGVFSGEKSAPLVTGLAIALLAVVGAMLIFMTGDGQAFGGAFVSDTFARFMKILALIGSITAMVMSMGQAKALELDKFEFPVLLVLAVCPRSVTLL